MKRSVFVVNQHKVDSLYLLGLTWTELLNVTRTTFSVMRESILTFYNPASIPQSSVIYINWNRWIAKTRRAIQSFCQSIWKIYII